MSTSRIDPERILPDSETEALPSFYPVSKLDKMYAARAGMENNVRRM